MSETRIIIGHAPHGRNGPHLFLPADFEALRLKVEDYPGAIEVACACAIVGRSSEADLRFAFPDVSRRHCRLVFEDGLWRVQDLQSLNGISLNDRRVTKATLHAGDRLRVGSVKMLIEAATPNRILATDQSLKR